MVVVTVTEWSARSRASINASLAYLDNFCRDGAHYGQLVLLDKTERGLVSSETIEVPPQIQLVIRRRPWGERLYISIGSLAEFLEGDGTCWVQILAEDDLILSGGGFLFSPDPAEVMFLPDLLLVGNRNRFESRGELHTIRHLQTLGASEIGGDTSWHGIVREDIMLIYCQWLSSLRESPNVHSNILIFLALAYGTASRLCQFVFIKEASLYDSPAKSMSRIRGRWEAAFGDGSLAEHNDLLNLLAATSLLSSDSIHADKNRLEDVRNLLMRKIQELCSGNPPQSRPVYRFFKKFRSGSKVAAEPLSLSRLLDLAEIRLGKKGEAVLRSLHLR